MKVVNEETPSQILLKDIHVGGVERGFLYNTCTNCSILIAVYSDEAKTLSWVQCVSGRTVYTEEYVTTDDDLRRILRKELENGNTMNLFYNEKDAEKFLSDYFRKEEDTKNG